MQGRLVAPVAGKIQAFPWATWEDEFPLAEELDLHLMEWTLDEEGLYDNPLMTDDGRRHIRTLSRRHGLEILSLTGDCFMQAPFHRAPEPRRGELLADLHAVLDSCASLGIRFVVVPLVDDGRVEDEAQEASLVDGLVPLRRWLLERHMCIVFESDFDPERLREFIEAFPADTFGVNYDIGNSASLGYEPAREVASYGGRILNVHVKDRVRGGTTVPLGEGNADLPGAFRALKAAGYRGNFILQTARATDEDHAGTIRRYRDMVEAWWQDGS